MMIRIKLTTLLLIILRIGFSQITTTNIEENQSFIDNPYDSITSISNDNYESHIGQTLFLKENNWNEKRGYYQNFYLSPEFGLSAKVNNKHYKEIEAKYPQTGSGSDYLFMKSRYYFVDSLIVSPNKDDFSSKNDRYFRLIEDETKDTLYYLFDAEYEDFYEFLTVGYFEKLKSSYIGRRYIYINKRSGLHPDEEGIRDLKDGKEIVEIPEKTIFSCKDISLSSGKYVRLIAILYNEIYGESYVKLNDIINTDASFYILKPVDGYNKELLEAEKYRKKLIARFGQSDARLILSGKVRVGFTKEMCIESWGKPKSINKTSGNYGNHEQWVYSGSNYLYFENGYLTTIQN